MSQVAKESSRKRAKHSPTIADVARDAGVSITTVSFVINEVSGVSIAETTRERVRASAEKLGYRPNAAAQQLRTRRSNTIGFVTDAVASNPFAGDVINGAQDAAWTVGKVLLIANAGLNPDIVASAVDLMLERRVEGLIYAADFHQEVQLTSAFKEVPCVLVDCFTDDLAIPSVVPDEVGGGFVATEALIVAGHRRIGYVAMRPDIPATVGRLHGYRQALAEYGISFDPALIVYGQDRVGPAYRLAQELMRLESPPTALFCGNDRTAMEVYDGLRDLGFRIPDDVSVVGFDNQEIIAARLRPPLSTVQLPHYEMGKWAVEQLVKLMDGEPTVPAQQTMPCPFVSRQSVTRAMSHKP